MENLKTLDSSILSLIILGFIFYNSRNRSENLFVSHKIFLALVLTNMFLIIFDLGSWAFDGLPGNHFILVNKLINLMLYIVNPVVGILWNFYIHYQVNYDENRVNRLKYILFTLFLINGVLAITSICTGWFFRIDSNNIYSRGSLYWVHIMFAYILLLYSISYIFKHRKIIEKKYYHSMLVFVIPITIGASIQIAFYGWALAWSGMTISMLIIYFNIQNRNLNTDYLTGVYNRRLLDSYLKIKIKRSKQDKSFSAILVDLDGFKKINDTFGHDVGDEAIKDAAQIIRSSLGRDDFVARYGGDEFFIIINSSDQYILENTVKTLKNNVYKFNQYSAKPYKLSFAVGYAVYDSKGKMNSDDFFKYIDEQMYIDKSYRKRKCTL